jgi:DNA replication protein DnaC
MSTAIQCSACEDTGWVATGDRFTRCTCVGERLRHDRLAASGLPPTFRRCTFDSYRAYNDTLQDALRIARAYTEDVLLRPRADGDRTPRGLCFSGPAGVGKTHLAAVILKTLILEQGVSGVFYTTRELLRLLRESYNPAIQTTEAEILRPLLACDLLVLDDLGAERLTEWVASTMDDIIDHRYNADRAVIVTTNFPDLEDPADLDGLLCRVGFRMHSRLRGMCRRVTLRGVDYRDVPMDTTDQDLQRLATARQPVTPGRDFRRGAKFRAPAGTADLKWPGGRGGNH